MTFDDQTQRAQLASFVIDFLDEELLRLNEDSHGKYLYDRQNCISVSVLVEAINYAVRDLERAEADHSGQISVQKYAAIICHHIARLRPVHDVYRIEGTSELEVVDINEMLAIPLAIYIVFTAVSTNEALQPLEWSKCSNESCQMQISGKVLRGLCFFKKTRRFMTAREGYYKKYFSYSLRHYSAGAFFLEFLLKQAVFFSCEQSAGQLSSSDDHIS